MSHRVELAEAGALGQVDAVLGKRLPLSFGLLAVDRLSATDRRHRLLERCLDQAVLFRQPAALALVVGEREQEQFGGDELVAALLRLLVGEVEQIRQVATDLDLAAVPLHLRQTTDRLHQRRLQRLHVDAGARQQRRGRPVFLLQQREQQVLRLDDLVVMAYRQALRVRQRLLELRRQFVQTHAEASSIGVRCSSTKNCSCSSKRKAPCASLCMKSPDQSPEAPGRGSLLAASRRTRAA
jgi:hypothetical protein